MSVPSIDLSRRPDDIAPDVRRACEDVGFLTVVGHGVPDELIGEVARSSRAFFDLPDAEKERYRGPAEAIGAPIYRPLGAEKLGVNVDQKASLDWGPSSVGEPLVPPRTPSSLPRVTERSCAPGESAVSPPRARA